MKVYGFAVGPLQENTYLLVGEDGRGAIVDPGDEPERILAEVRRVGLKPEAILLTHAHFDHVGAVAPLVEALGLPVYLHPADLPLYQSAAQSAARWGLYIPQPPEPTLPLAEGQTLDLGLGLEVLFLPGMRRGMWAFTGQATSSAGMCSFAGALAATTCRAATHRSCLLHCKS